MRDTFLHVTIGPGYDGILALGNEALFVTTGHSGIMNYRGRELECLEVPVTASVSPAAVLRTPSQGALLHADVKSLLRRVSGDTVPGNEPSEIITVDTARVLKGMLADLNQTEAVAFDLETSGYDEGKSGVFVVSLAVTTAENRCYAVPLCHKDAPGPEWWTVLQDIARAMRKVPVRIGHNAKFDCRWLAQFDASVPCNFDTMLAAHILDENRIKGLKGLAAIVLGAPEWDIHIKAGKKDPPWYEQQPLAEILRYNALDTWHTMRLYRVFKPQLEEQPRLKTVFEKIMMPASQSFVHIERHGVYVDRNRLVKHAEHCETEIARIEDLLCACAPENPPYSINWNPSNFLRWFLFEYHDLPVLAKGKTGPSVAEGVMERLADLDHQAADIVRLLLERTRWEKMRSTYFAPYQELITEDSRLRTTFKLAGTVTGRLASGKADADKVTGSSQIRGVNLQQVPRDKLVRGLFGAPPGWLNVSADYSQLELRLAAELAQEPTMLSLYRQGADIHRAMAMRMTGKPADAVTKEERTRAKAVNFGFLYGMGAEGFVTQAFSDYGVRVSLEEAERFRDLFFSEFAGLRSWHSKQKRLVHKYKRVESPLGRVRHLPDIDSPDRSVVAEAERQAINSPVQGLGSDLCLLSINLLHRKFIEYGLRSQITGNVHDAINFEIPEDELWVTLPMVKQVMENPPLTRLFGVTFTVPIIVDLSVGDHWSEQEEIKDLDQWLSSKNVTS
ncbi:MAG: hypothetical protein LC723_13360 [Actinobacteria bacterium]|nr:hypothetical protein [Actinomycetota bacterium]